MEIEKTACTVWLIDSNNINTFIKSSIFSFVPLIYISYLSFCVVS